jgi:Na+-translocating ferredoxin:NAD+ oxidoreductase RnfG subunit
MLHGLVAGASVVVVAPSAALADQTYLRDADVPKAMFPESTGAERKMLELSAGELAALSQKLGRRVDVAKYPYIEVRKQDEALGLVFILDVVGQSRPITFAVAIGPDGRIRDLQVMVYREPQGEQIQDARFRRQFAGKRAQDPVALGRDIDAISGATISSRAATYAAKKALGLWDVLRTRAGGPQK